MNEDGEVRNLRSLNRKGFKKKGFSYSSQDLIFFYLSLLIKTSLTHMASSSSSVFVFLFLFFPSITLPMINELLYL